jgi:hypothetical protein
MRMAVRCGVRERLNTHATTARLRGSIHQNKGGPSRNVSKNALNFQLQLCVLVVSTINDRVTGPEVTECSYLLKYVWLLNSIAPRSGS